VAPGEREGGATIPEEPTPDTVTAGEPADATSRFATVVLGAADRFAEALADPLGASVAVSAGEATSGSAGGLLPRIGEVVVVLERAVLLPGPESAARATGGLPASVPPALADKPPVALGEGPSVQTPLFGLCAGPDGAWLAALAGGHPEAAAEQRAAGFDPEQQRDPVGAALDAVLRTAADVLADGVALAPEEAAGQPKVFSLEKDLNRAVSFLGEGDLSAATLTLSAGEAGEATVWILARSDLEEALAARPPRAREDRAPQVRLQSLLRIAVPVIVMLAEKRLTVEELLQLAIGQVVIFDKPCDEFLELMVNNQCIGRGEAVKVGDRFGLRIVEIGDVRDTIRKLGQPGSTFTP